jgi:hypothetical protein
MCEALWFSEVLFPLKVALAILLIGLGPRLVVGIIEKARAPEDEPENPDWRRTGGRSTSARPSWPATCSGSDPRTRA